jgi:hypothetical protein
MLTWVPIATNEPQTFRGKPSPASAAVVGSSVVLRFYHSGLFSIPVSTTSIAFASETEASAWIEANRLRS